MASLSGFFVAVEDGAGRPRTSLVCGRCAADRAPDVVATTGPYTPHSEMLDPQPTLAELVAAANRHTWEKHPHPQR